MRPKTRHPRSVFFTLSIIALLLFLVACTPCCFFGDNDDGNDTKTSSVVGTCYISTGSERTPVPNVTVTIGNSKTETDSKGFFRITGLAPGAYTIVVAGGDLGYTGKVVVVKGGLTINIGDLQLHPTLPPPNTAGTTGTTDYPATAEDVIRAYYKALNDRDYSGARDFLAEQMSEPEPDDIKSAYEPYVKDIDIVKIERRASMDYNDRQIYVVTFKAVYLKQYPAGHGNLPTVHALKQITGQWKIVDIGTG